MIPALFLLSASSLLALADTAQQAAFDAANGTRGRHLLGASVVFRELAAPADAANCERQAQAYHALGDRPRALAWVRRGLRAAPLDRVLWQRRKDLIDELARASGRPVADYGPPTPRLDHSGLESAVLALIGWPLLAWQRRRPIGIILVATACYMMLGAAADRSTAENQSREPVAILTSPVVPREGNAEDYPGVAAKSWPAGCELQILGDRGGWARVTGPGGVVGWVPGLAFISIGD